MTIKVCKECGVATHMDNDSQEVCLWCEHGYEDATTDYWEFIRLELCKQTTELER